ncbi:MAG: phospholipase D-like domain-containing protein [Acidobacteriota bacterium]
MELKNEFRISRHHGTTMILLPLVIFIGTVLALLFTALLLWSTKHSTNPRFHVARAGNLTAMLPSIASLSDGTLDSGNEIELLQNGQFFERLIPDLEAAKETIHFETYLWHKGEIGTRLATIFAAKARQGVEVRLTLDSNGTRPMPNELEKMMKEAGCKISKYHHFTLASIGKFNNRDHRKICVIDGRIGYTGGHDVAPEWTGNARNKHEFRDTSVRVRGPIVNRLQGAFSENWIEQTGEVLAGPKYFPPPLTPGHAVAHLAYMTPMGGNSAVALMYYLGIVSAKKEIIIENPYFLPDPEGLKALEAAAKRGVVIRIVLPATTVTDAPIVQHASHHHFGDLLKYGIHIYEYQTTLLHQKIMIVDNQWACVGSTNFDDRSFELNDEISMGIVDPAIISGLKKAFESDLKTSVERHLDEWRDRGIGHKLMDGAFYLVNEQL